MTKTNIRKRTISILLILMVMLTMTPMTASAAGGFVEVSTYEQLRNEVNKGSTKIKLVADIDTTSENGNAGLTSTTNLTFKGGGHVLDLNGHTLKLVTSVKDTHLIAVESQDMTIKDSSTSGSGKIEMEFGENLINVQYPIYVSGMGSLTIDGGTFSSSFNFVNYIECYGSLTINGGTIVSNSTKQVNLIKCENANLTINGGKLQIPQKNEHGISYGYAVYTENQFGDNCQIVITGGEIDGKVAFTRNDSSVTGTPKYNKLPVKITGGVFKQKVYAYYSQKPSGEITEFSPAVEIAGGTFKEVYNENLVSSNGLATKLTAGTFEKSANIVTHVSSATMAGYRACLGNSVILRGNECRTAYDWSSMQGFEVSPTGAYVLFREAVVIPNAWGMKSVTLDGTKTINYAKDWKGEVERMDNSTAHTLKFEWYPLASELINAGYSYRAKCEHYISGSSAVQQTDTIDDGATSHTVTIPAGVDPKVYSYDLQLNLQKDGSSVGIMVNQHIVKLVVSEAPVVEPDPTLTGKVYYTSGIVFGRSISTAVGNLPDGFDSNKLSYQWQRSENSGSTWENIDGANKGSYTPMADDMGENVRIRVKVTAEGYLGEIVSAAVKVSKAANNNYPDVIKLEAVKNGAVNYNGFKIANFDPDCEYVYSTTDTPNWSANQISSATVTGLTSDTTYYVFARFKETATHTAGSIVSKNSIKLFDNVPLDRVLLEGYGSSGTIYIKKGESVTLKVNADPSNANDWKAITFKDEGATTSNIAISNGTINASTGTATPFPNGHTITITGVSKGSANLRASYPSATSSAYGTWNVVVYDDSTVANALRLESVYAYEDITLSENDTADLPINLPKLLPENSGYQLEWRILKRGTYGSTYVTENDNIKLEDGKIKPKAAHAGSEKTQLELVAVKDGSDTYRTLPKTSLFYVTVTEAPVIELTGVTVAPTKVNLDFNATYQLSAVKEPVNAKGDLIWESDKPDVATVDSTGKVTAKAKGKATITVSCGDKKDTCTVTVAHTHNTDSQTWAPLNDNEHFRSCTAGDDFKMEAHVFSTWTKVDENTHKGICSKCSYAKTENHSWVFDHEDAPTVTTEGTRYYKCSATGCTATKTESIPVLTEYSITVSNDGNGKATASPAKAPAGTEITLTATPKAGYHFKEWKVVSGGVTITGNKFTMFNDNVEIKAIFEKNASSGGYVPTVQKPEITIIGSGKADLSADGRTATITANAGHELVSVVLNGKEMGKVEKLTGLKTGDKATITFQAKADGKAEMDKMIAQKASKLKLMARSAKTAKKNIKVVVKGDLKAITDAGYTVKYKFYRSTKKSAGYKAMLTKKAPTYYNTYGKKGTMYYYKARVMIYDKDGNFVAQTALKQCKYANRLWTK